MAAKKMPPMKGMMKREMAMDARGGPRSAAEKAMEKKMGEKGKGK